MYVCRQLVLIDWQILLLIQDQQLAVRQTPEIGCNYVHKVRT
jgi:hypothetical protein